VTRILPRTSAAAEGLDEQAVRALVGRLDALGVIHGLVLVRNGNVVAEGSWAPYRNDVPHSMFSVSKSFTATAVGLAIDEGLFGLDDRVVDLLASDVPADPSERLQSMRVRHLLTMTTGHAFSTMEALDVTSIGRPGGDWVRQILAMPVEHEPGTHFVYNTGATYLAGIIVQRLTGMRLLDYLRPRLFEPLGISTATWEQDPDGLDVAGFGLSITVEELAAFGQLYLQRGQWEGRQLVPAAWVDRATSKQVENAPHESPDWEQGYGFQFWQCRHGAYRADGAFGQFAVVWPEHRIVLAITSGTMDMQAVLDAVWATLASPGLHLPYPQGPATSPREADVRDVPYVLDVAVGGIASITVTRSDADQLMLRMVVDGSDYVAPCGYGEWLPGLLAHHGQPAAVCSAAAWTDESRLEVRTAVLGTPFVQILGLRLGDGSIDVSLDLNASFGPTHVGTATAAPKPS
jgi:CubicO group peptidase (beta-lactamase class C family)